MEREGSAYRRNVISRIVLLIGLVVWTCAQGYLLLTPLWLRSLPPEPDDVLPYIVRTARLTECWSSECPALKDLREQLLRSRAGRETGPHRAWAATTFGLHRPLFSAVLILVNQFSPDLTTAYKIMSSFAPLFFGAAFAYLLTVLWGRRAAGVGLILLAFKVFPDAGLYFLVPSNMAMGLAVFLWARVISRKGAAPVALTVGSVAVIAAHPIGVVYAVIGCGMALVLRGSSLRGRALGRTALLAAGLLMVIAVTAYLVGLGIYLRALSPLALLTQGAASVFEVARKIMLIKEGLIGSIPLFFAAIGLGFLTVSGQDRTTIAKVLMVPCLFLVAGLFYPPRQPGDVFLRMWIPVLVILYGAIGQALCWSLAETLKLLKKGLPSEDSPGRVGLANYWPVLAFLLILGHGVQISIAGGEQIIVMADHYRRRQPIAVCDSQTRILESEARPGQRVLYTSMLIMPYYLTRGAMKLGAVYYHPVLKDSLKEWLQRPDLRFAVTYNPLMYHPAFEGLHERRWGTASPQFYFTPLNKGARHYRPVLEEDSVSAADYKWIEVEPRGETAPKVLRLLFRNTGDARAVQIIPVDEAGKPLTNRTITRTVPAEGSSGMRMEQEDLTDFKTRFDPLGSGKTIVDVDLQELPPARRFRIVFPGWEPKVRIAGIRFDESKLNWPWHQKARVVFMHKRWKVGELAFTFDPSLLLPDPLSSRNLTVLNDCGSSVLIRIDQ